MPDQDTGGARRTQEVRLAVIIDRFMQLRRRLAVLEGNDPDDEIAPRPENIAGLQKFVDDDHPACAHLRAQFWNEMEGHVDDLRHRLNDAVKIVAARRRQTFTVIEGDQT